MTLGTIRRLRGLVLLLLAFGNSIGGPFLYLRDDRSLAQPGDAFWDAAVGPVQLSEIP